MRLERKLVSWYACVLGTDVGVLMCVCVSVCASLQVDFAIVCISVLVLALQAITTNAQIATALRVLRAVKPLRLLTRSEGMRIVFKSVMLSMAAMANVSLVCIMFFLIFAILGTQLFMGLFWR